MAGNEPNKINVTGNSIHCRKTDILLMTRHKNGMVLGIGGNSIVLKMAETNMPAMETVIILPVKIGKLKDKTVKLNFEPPSKIGSQPNKNNSSAAVDHDQNPSIMVYK